MSAIADITMFDDDAQGVGVTFLPVGFPGGIATWKIAGSTSAGDRVATQTLSESNTQRPTDRVRLKLVLPYEVQQEDESYEIKSVGYANLDVTIPGDWPASMRETFMNNLEGLLKAGSPAHAAIHDGIHTY